MFKKYLPLASEGLEKAKVYLNQVPRDLSVSMQLQEKQGRRKNHHTENTRLPSHLVHGHVLHTCTQPPGARPCATHMYPATWCTAMWYTHVPSHLVHGHVLHTCTQPPGARPCATHMLYLSLPDWQWFGESCLYTTWAQRPCELCTMDPSKTSRKHGSGGARGAGLGIRGQLRHCLAGDESREGLCEICFSWQQFVVEFEVPSFPGSHPDRTPVYLPAHTSPLQLALQFAASQVLSSHSGPVTCLAAIYPPSDLTTTADRGGKPPTIHAVIASGSSDSSVIVWERRTGEGKWTGLYLASFLGSCVCVCVCVCGGGGGGGGGGEPGNEN